MIGQRVRVRGMFLVGSLRSIQYIYVSVYEKNRKAKSSKSNEFIIMESQPLNASV